MTSTQSHIACFKFFFVMHIWCNKHYKPAASVTTLCRRRTYSKKSAMQPPLQPNEVAISVRPAAFSALFLSLFSLVIPQYHISFRWPPVHGADYTHSSRLHHFYPHFYPTIQEISGDKEMTRNDENLKKESDETRLRYLYKREICSFIIYLQIHTYVCI